MRPHLLPNCVRFCCCSSIVSTCDHAHAVQIITSTKVARPQSSPTPQTSHFCHVQYQLIKSLHSVSKNNRFTVWIVPFRTVFLSSFLTSVFVGVIRTYIRTVYTHCLYARDKTSSASGFAKIVRVSSVNLKTVFTCYSKQRILVHTTVKATKPLAGTVVTWNCFVHFYTSRVNGL